MKKHILHRSLGLLTLLVIATPLARAHSVWIEDTSDKQLVVSFDEPGEIFEQSPGCLDSLTMPTARTVDAGEKPVVFELRKNSDHFRYVGASPAQTAFGETAFPVKGKDDLTRHQTDLPYALAALRSVRRRHTCPRARPCAHGRTLKRAAPSSTAKPT